MVSVDGQGLFPPAITGVLIDIIDTPNGESTSLVFPLWNAFWHTWHLLRETMFAFGA